MTTSSKLLIGEIRKWQKPSDRRGRYHSFHVVSEDLALSFLAADGTRISHEMETSSCFVIALTNCSAKEAAWEIPLNPSLNLGQVPGMLMLAFDA